MPGRFEEALPAALGPKLQLGPRGASAPRVIRVRPSDHRAACRQNKPAVPRSLPIGPWIEWQPCAAMQLRLIERGTL